MKWFVIVVSTLFVVIGIAAIRDGKPIGWGIAGFFGLCLLIAIFESRLAKWKTGFDYRVTTTAEEVACTAPRRKRESIRWEEIQKVWYITTSSGPRVPDEWILLEGEEGGCSFPTEAAGFDAFLEGLGARFPGFDFGPVIRGGTTDTRHLCWERTKS